MIEPHCTNFRITTASFRVSRYLGILQQILIRKLTIVLQNRKSPKISDTRKFAVITLKVEQDHRWRFLRVMHPNDAMGIANSVDPEQSDLGLHCLPRKFAAITLKFEQDGISLEYWWVCTVCPDLSVLKLRKSMVILIREAGLLPIYTLWTSLFVI